MARLQTHPGPREHTRCQCDHTSPEHLEHSKICPLHTGRDTIVGWIPAETLQQHEGWLTHSHAHQATEHLFRDPLSTEAGMRGAVTQALQQHPTNHAQDPVGAAAHLQLEAVRRAAAQMVHRKRLLLTHTEQLTDCTVREQMLRLMDYHVVESTSLWLPEKDPFVATLLDETESSVGLSTGHSSSSEGLLLSAFLESPWRTKINITT